MFNARYCGLHAAFLNPEAAHRLGSPGPEHGHPRPFVFRCSMEQLDKFSPDGAGECPPATAPAATAH